ncbi:stress-induced hydrophobic peptide [Heterobasidion irregulare TC 32-1]|uniref:Stress-induced hydrophobic peptide n=1 Tax=Heterobasidion irregulare (strain TC 32-1) TaxID=747525 RepID=W4JSD4_HETIT|nr:stress-induced hydrophobic peptide [Heterobasidion irregulare TC 32-1]ETW76020.1 stress-induced hydrophobic peptide [Heterobasidion irregulare TC 32-1]
MPRERKVARWKEHRTEADDVTAVNITAVQSPPPTTFAHGSIPFSSSPQSKRRSRTNKMPSQVSSTSDVILYFLAIFIPPIPVFMKRACGADLLINILLWILGWIPGVLHAWYIISKSEGAM